MESSVGENGSEGTSFPHCIQTLPTHGAFSLQSELHETKGSAFHPIHFTSLCKTCFYQTKPQNVCKAAHLAINVIIRNEAHPENCRVPTFYSLEWPRSGEVRSKSCTVALLIILVEQGVRGGVVVVVEVSQWWGMVMETQELLYASQDGVSTDRDARKEGRVWIPMQRLVICCCYLRLLPTPRFHVVRPG